MKMTRMSYALVMAGLLAVPAAMAGEHKKMHSNKMEKTTSATVVEAETPVKGSSVGEANSAANTERGPSGNSMTRGGGTVGAETRTDASKAGIVRPGGM